MPANLIYVFYPKGAPREAVDVIRKAIETTRDEIKKELRKTSYTATELLEKWKNMLKSKLTGLPIQTRISCVLNSQESNRAIVAERVCGWDKRLEKFISVALPSFDKVIDPEVNPEVTLHVPVPTEWGTIGFCQALGAQNASILVGGGIAFLTFFITLGVTNDGWKALAIAIVLGAIASGITYFTCRGVEAGIPIAMRK